MLPTYKGAGDLYTHVMRLGTHELDSLFLAQSFYMHSV